MEIPYDLKDADIAETMQDITTMKMSLAVDGLIMIFIIIESRRPSG